MKKKTYTSYLDGNKFEYTFDEYGNYIHLNQDLTTWSKQDLQREFAVLKSRDATFNLGQYAARLDRWARLEYTISRLNAAKSSCIKAPMLRTLKLQMEELEIDMADNLARFGADELDTLVEYAKNPNHPMSSSNARDNGIPLHLPDFVSETLQQKIDHENLAI